MNPSSRLLFITGERGAGKTTLCLRLAGALRARGLRVAGLITRRTEAATLEAVDVASGEVFSLAQPVKAPSPHSLMLHFDFDPVAIAASAQAFLRSFPVDVFFLDEIGPLELVYRQGWATLLDALPEVSYRRGVIVVRPELLGVALQRLPGPTFTVARVKPDQRDALFAELLTWLEEAM